MAITIGIDVGGSTTKIIGIENKKVKSPLLITAQDPVTSLFGAFGKYLHDNSLFLTDIKKIVITGVGSSSIKTPLYGIETVVCDEFIANALGARYHSGLENLIVISMGTGTSFIKIQGNKFKHIGGLGIGGGTLSGLSRIMLNNSKILDIANQALDGDVSNVNLLIKDICNKPLPNLPLTATAANFGKADGNSKPEDIAAGIIMLILQTIGSAANMAAQNTDIKDFVLIGNLAKLPQCPQIFKGLGELYNLNFHIPSYAEYRTALGAALSGTDEI